MRRFLSSAAIASFLLTGCGGGSQASACDGARSPIERFSICLPNEWTQRTQPYGETGNLLTLVTPAGGDNSMMRMYIKKDPLREPIKSGMTFAESMVEFTRNTAPNYQVISTEPIKISNVETLLHIFYVTPEQETEPIRYYQFVITQGDIAYGFTALMHQDADEELTEQLLKVFQSVQFS